MTAAPIAHRGLHRPGPACPENSLAALDAAFEAGFPAEVDVQLSRDGEVVIFHDHGLKRLTGVPGKLSDRTVRQISRLRIHGGGETPPLLRDAVALFPDLPLLIELKMGDPRLPGAVAAVLDGYDGPFAVQSFDPDIVRWFADNRPDWPRGLIAYEKLQFSFRAREPRYLPSFIPHCRPDFVAWHVGDLPVPPDVPADLPVLTWTVRSHADRRRAKRHADNMIFEGFWP
ncbi:MAG: glycerophosphodiester phosphodiesterase family protein [Minwuia sp.]|uniref:glycerophosphodiester phosphodiesterase family protein n=1 Tax=Minwuia sp. TaxID=2493630 RepID=UPI003A854CB0